MTDNPKMFGPPDPTDPFQIAVSEICDGTWQAIVEACPKDDDGNLIDTDDFSVSYVVGTALSNIIARLYAHAGPADIRQFLNSMAGGTLECHSIMMFERLQKGQDDDDIGPTKGSA